MILAEKCVAMDGYRLIQDCGDYPECDECDGSPRAFSVEEFQLRGSLRAGK